MKFEDTEDLAYGWEATLEVMLILFILNFLTIMGITLLPATIVRNILLVLYTMSLGGSLFFILESLYHIHKGRRKPGGADVEEMY